MKALEWITKEAKKLRKEYPKRFATWREYVAQASAIYASKHKGKSPVGKKKIGAIKIVEKGESKNARPKAVYEYSRSKKGTFKGLKKIGATKSSSHKDTKSHNVNIRVVSGIQKISGLFDTSVLNDIDSLKKEYYKLAKKYHPDAGGTDVQFQQLQNEYEKLFKSLLNGSKLNNEQKDNEILIDQEIRNIIDQLINIEGLNVEVIGKWLWISGNTYPVKDVLKKAGLTFIKKNNKPYWVYKGVESSGRGNMSIEEIKQKYGVHKIDLPKTKVISGISRINKSKLYSSLLKLKKALNKRPI